MNVMDTIRMQHMKPKDKIPKFKVGDTVRVHFRIVEGEKERIQVYEGTVIGRKGGEGPMARFTVRRLAYNEGVERVFPLHSPRVEKVEIVREGKVRRAKLHYLRNRAGKAARVKALGRSFKNVAEAVKAVEAGEAPVEVLDEVAKIAAEEDQAKAAEDAKAAEAEAGAQDAPEAETAEEEKKADE